jgi:hypothetical protein
MILMSSLFSSIFLAMRNITLYSVCKKSAHIALCITRLFIALSRDRLIQTEIKN